MFWPSREFPGRRNLLPALITLCVALVTFSACGRRPPRAPVPLSPVPGASETGIASWYGHPYHGRRAANGEVYDMEQLTAAHRTLPFGTWVRVLNLSNSKVVDVRINDRGPFVDGRIIDLSLAAARAIDMVGPGTARVRIQVIAAPEESSAEFYAVQVGAFRDVSNARRLRDLMERQYGSAQLLQRDGDPVLWRVLVGERLNAEQAAALLNVLRHDHRQAFLVRTDAP